MSIVRDFEMAFNRQDVTALVACFTPTGRYRDTFFGEHIGHAALRAMFERMFHEGRDYADRKSTRLNSSHSQISYAVFCLKKKKREELRDHRGSMSESYHGPSERR